MLSLAATVFSLLLLAVVLQDAFEVMLLPRRIQRRVRMSRVYFVGAWTIWVRLSRLLPEGGRRIRFLGAFGPLAMMVLFACWAGLLILSFGILSWVLQGRPARISPLDEQVYMSGVTFFTVGYGDVAPHALPTRTLAVMEGGTGLGFIAIVIGYLPVLYQLFARREAHVIQLDGRAGSPPSGVGMLAIHAELDGLAELDELLREWEVWGSELLESHLSYPMLVYYRSQHDDQSWLAAMTAVIDACALILVGAGGVRPLQARMTFTMIRQVVVEISRALSVTPSSFEGGDRLPQAEFRRMLSAFAEAGLDWTDAPDSEEVLHALRATYEPLLDGLSRRLLLPLPAWMPQGKAVGHWQGGHRGLIASRLVAQLAGSPRDAVQAAPTRGSLGRHVRSRMGR